MKVEVKAMKEKIKKVNKVKSFIIIIIVFIVFVIGYSYFTTHRVLNDLLVMIENNELMLLEYEDIDEYLKDNGYSIQKNEEYDDIQKVYVKNDEKIIISDNSMIEYRFIYSDREMTPRLYNVEWNDSFKEVKAKLGINILNTRLSSLELDFRTSIVVSNTSIIITADHGSDYAYFLEFDENKLLKEITVIKYNLTTVNK